MTATFKVGQNAVAIDVKAPEYTGLSVSYYKVPIKKPTSGGDPYIAECNDIIEALNMNYAEGNVFKAIWRMCAARGGLGKKGYTDGLYDAEKVVYFGERLVVQIKDSLTKHPLPLSTVASLEGIDLDEVIKSIPAGTTNLEHD